MVTRVKVRKQTNRDVFWGIMRSRIFPFKVCKGKQFWESQRFQATGAMLCFSPNTWSLWDLVVLVHTVTILALGS